MGSNIVSWLIKISQQVALYNIAKVKWGILGASTSAD